jgi:hypothetical protein
MSRQLLAAVVALLLLVVGAPAALAGEPGDDPGAAIDVSAGVSTWDSTDMTQGPDDPDSCKDFPGPEFATMWFRYEPSRKGPTIVDVNSFVSEDGTTDYLAGVFVFRDDGGTLTQIDCSAFPASVFLTAQAGATYLIMVSGLSTEATEDPDLSDRGGTFDLSITAVKGRVLSDHFHDAGESLDEEGCPGGPILVSWDDNGNFKTFFGTTGPRRFTTFFQGSTTFTDVGDGQRLTLKYAQTFTDRLDGSGVITGLAQDVWLDGKRVVKDVGRLVFDVETGEVTFDAGRHPQWYEGLDICAELGLGGD